MRWLLTWNVHQPWERMGKFIKDKVWELTRSHVSSSRRWGVPFEGVSEYLRSSFNLCEEEHHPLFARTRCQWRMAMSCFLGSIYHVLPMIICRQSVRERGIDRSLDIDYCHALRLVRQTVASGRNILCWEWQKLSGNEVFFMLCELCLHSFFMFWGLCNWLHVADNWSLGTTSVCKWKRCLAYQVCWEWQKLNGNEVLLMFCELCLRSSFWGLCNWLHVAESDRQLESLHWRGAASYQSFGWIARGQGFVKVMIASRVTSLGLQWAGQWASCFGCWGSRASECRPAKVVF